MDAITVVGVRADGSTHTLGTAPMPPGMKQRDIVRNYFGEPNDADPMACDDATLCLAALEAYHEWLLQQGWQPPLLTITPPGPAADVASAEDPTANSNTCPACGKPWLEHDFGVPRPYCP